MVKSKGWKLFGTMCVCSAALILSPQKVLAGEAGQAVQVEASQVSLYSEKSESSSVVGKAVKGDTYDVVETSDGWVKVSSEDGAEGYLLLEGNGALVSADEAADKNVRQDVVDYALTFLGNPYRYGGSDPHTGADCSGFTSYVIEHAAGVDMNRSSRSQAVQGKQISAEQMQPGDLVFYGSGNYINHVGIYIGNGQIVHASTERTGIKTSPWTYRTPVKIVSVLG